MNYYFRSLYHQFRIEVLAVPGRVIALVLVVLFSSLPLITTDPYILRIFILTAIFAIYAASWDLLAGFVGQLSLGHALFFGVAAYTTALLNKHFGLSPLVTIPCGGLSAVLVGLIAGLPALRLRGFYLALVTLSFPVILTGLVYVFPKFTGGELGIYDVDSLSGSRICDYYIIFVVMLISVFIMYKFSDSESKYVRTGVIFHAIREDEIAARVSGIYTSRYKLLAFAISGIFAGIAGGLYAHLIRVAGPSILELLFSFQPILWTVFGGIATIYGPVVGVYILFPLLEILGFHPWGEATRYIIFALFLMITLFFMPQGITTWVRDKIEVKCPRCKLINMSTRKTCRACRAALHNEVD